MQTITHPANRRRRRHRAAAPPAIPHSDRRALELAGWRTLLEYRENHVRDQDGTLSAIVPQWTGEAERDHQAGTRSARAIRSSAQVLSVTADDPAAVWAYLRRMIDEMAVSRSHGAPCPVVRQG